MLIPGFEAPHLKDSPEGFPVGHHRPGLSRPAPEREESSV